MATKNTLKSYQMVRKSSLAEWLEEKLNERGWKPSDLAKAANIPDATVSRILNQNRNAGPDVCVSIARAFNEPPEFIFRLAGLLPPLPAAEGDLTLQEISDISKNLSPEGRQHLLEIAQTFYVREHQAAYRTAPENNPPNLNNAAPATT